MLLPYWSPVGALLLVKSTCGPQAGFVCNIFKCFLWDPEKAPYRMLLEIPFGT